jgi:SAM-dependent methyltransferase
MLQTEKLILPKILTTETIVSIATPNSKYPELFSRLGEGELILIEGTFGSALSLYSWLKKRIAKKFPEKDYRTGRIHKKELQSITSHLLIKINQHQADLKGAPVLPWLKDFFPQQDSFFISFPDFLGMNGAYQWYKNGIKYPGLNLLIHPFYGTYFPTRFEHLELFDNWLKSMKGVFSTAIDIGAGCGVLSLYLLKHGISLIDATDINPNAVYSFEKDINRNKLTENIHVYNASFFADLKKQYDLIVFNPPWIPGEAMDMIDQGMYYPEGFLEDFLSEAKNKLNPNGRIVILFSNFTISAGVTNYHPLEKAMEKAPFLKVENISKEKVRSGNAKKSTHWMNKVRENEWVELWEIKSA